MYLSLIETTALTMKRDAMKIRAQFSPLVDADNKFRTVNHRGKESRNAQKDAENHIRAAIF